MLDPFRTRFVGRDGELQALGARVDEGARVVTLLGAPGIGKSRLALHFVAGRHPEPAAYLDLGATGGAGECERALAELLVRDGSAPRLVLLDNAEHAVDEARANLARWSARAGAGSCIVTSRQALELPAEVTLEVGPLPVPSESTRTLADLDKTDGGRLFLARVAFASQLSDADASVIAEIVRRLGGNPLAIELAAGRTSVLGPQRLLERLDGELDLLGGSPERRHGSLRAAIDASFVALGTWEQDALVQCSVFHTSFSLEAAESVVALASGAPPLVDVLHGLVDRCLLRSEVTPQPAEVRLSMDANVRRYAAERRALRPDRDAIAARSVGYYERWAQAVVAPPTRAASRGVLETIGGDVENMAGALESALETGALTGDHLFLVRDGALRLGKPMSGRPKVGSYALLESAAFDLSRDEVAAGGEDHALRAAVYRLVGVGLGSVGRHERARSYLERALAAAASIADAHRAARWRADIGCALGALAAVVEDWHKSAFWFAEARAAVARARDPLLGAVVACHRGNALLFARKPEDALRAFAEAEASAAAADVGAKTIAASIPFNTAVALQDLGRLDESERCLQSAIELHRAGGDELSRGGTLAQLGAVHQEASRFADAEAAYTEALGCFAGRGVPRAEATLRAWLGCLLACQGRGDEAAAALAEARVRVDQAGDRGAAITWRLARVALDLAGERALRTAGDVAAAGRARATAAARLAGAGSYVDPRELGPPTFASVDHDDDHRFLRRILARELDRGAVMVAEDGSCFRQASGELVEVAQSRHARLLALLALRRASADAELPLSPDDLVEGVWPGERMTRASAQNRLQVSLTALRNLGLRDLIRRHADGYLLDPGQAVVVLPGAEVRRRSAST